MLAVFFSRLLKSPGNFSSKKNCFMLALFEIKTKSFNNIENDTMIVK